MRIVASSGINNDANIVKEKIYTFSQDISKMQNIIDSIPRFWEGTDATSFINKYKDVLVNLKKYEASLNDYYSYMSRVYDIFNTLDEAYDKSINTN